MSYTCPVCLRTSYHPDDERYGYCGYCHVFTNAPPVPQEAVAFLNAVIKESERASGADPEVLNGNERHSSSSTPAGQERKMRMPTNDEDGKAQPEVPQMQGEGDCPSLLALRRERMEPKDESTVRPVQWSGISGSVEPKWTTPETTDGTIQWVAPDAPIPPPEPGYPSKFRFYTGAVGLGFAVGITWTVFMLSPLIVRHITKGHAITLLYIFVVIVFVAQGHMLYRWNKALEKRRAELNKFWEEHFPSEPNPWKEKHETIKERYGLTDEE